MFGRDLRRRSPFFLTHLSSELHSIMAFLTDTGGECFWLLSRGLILAWTADRAHLPDYCGCYLPLDSAAPIPPSPPSPLKRRLPEGRRMGLLPPMAFLANNILCLLAVFLGIYIAGLHEVSR